MSKKLTWDKIYKDFKTQYVSMGKNIVWWHPHDFAAIKLYFKDGSIGIYKFVNKSFERLEDTWLYKK